MSLNPSTPIPTAILRLAGAHLAIIRAYQWWGVVADCRVRWYDAEGNSVGAARLPEGASGYEVVRAERQL